MDHISVFMFDLWMISMSSECEYDWYWIISTCSTEYEICGSFASLNRQQTSYYGSQADIFDINQFTHPDNIYMFGLLNIENRVQQQESVIYTQSTITKVHIIYILYKKID
jgi:hypothetical protein